jgi:hypothetical protein
VTGPDTLKEIHQACGGHYGGNTVNEEFFKFLERFLWHLSAAVNQNTHQQLEVY